MEYKCYYVSNEIEEGAVELLTDLLHAWWFWAAFAAYLLSGVRVGSFCYDVYDEPQNHYYWTRFMVSPLSTVFGEGWMGNFASGGREPLGGYPVLFGAIRHIFAGYFCAGYPKATYISVLSVGWGLKAVLNLALIVLIGTLSLLTIVWMIVILVIPWVAGAIIFSVAFIARKLV